MFLDRKSMGFVMSLSSKSGFLYEKMITVGFYCDICFPGTDSGRIDQHKMDREWVANVSRRVLNLDPHL
jgi:hypothetical protein